MSYSRSQSSFAAWCALLCAAAAACATDHEPAGSDGDEVTNPPSAGDSARPGVAGERSMQGGAGRGNNATISVPGDVTARDAGGGSGQGSDAGPSDGPDPDDGAEPRELRELTEVCRVSASLGPSEAMWTNLPSLAGYTHVSALAVDDSGNFTVATGFEGVFDLGDEALDARDGQYALLVSKYDSSCRRLWSKSYGALFGWVGGAAVAASGTELVLAGTFASAVDFGAGTLVSPANTAGVLFKLDANGDTLWSEAFLGSGSGRFYDVAVDAEGEIVVTGIFYGEGSLGGDTLGDAAAGEAASFVAKFSASGAHRWSQVVPGDIYSELMVDVMRDGTIVVGGISQPSANVVAFDPDGALLWSRKRPQIETSFVENQLGLAVGADGEVAVSYNALEEMRKLELARLAPDGGERLQTTLRRANQAYPLGALALDPAGRAFEAGAFMDTLDQTEVRAEGDMDAYVMVHDPTGSAIGYAQVGTPKPDYALSLAVGGDGHAVLAVVTHQASFSDDLTLVRYAPW